MTEAAADADFVVDLEVFEGPLDLLLDLARRERVDLSRVPVARLAAQYLAFIEQAQRLRLEVAGDLLVMAAWLTLLKSRLLLPRDPDDDADEPSAEDMAADLAHRLRRLEAMRHAAEALAARDRLGRDVFGRGAPEGMNAAATTNWTASLYDLVHAYARQRVTTGLAQVTIEEQPVWALADARSMLEDEVVRREGWRDLGALLMAAGPAGVSARSIMASGVSAALELTRDGAIEIEQDAMFGPLRVKGARHDDV